jgi:AcrR family transcriptional regulator
MTDKKEKILNAALELFANDGYNATPTSKIARQAGVSEGLIFRHFENKKGLLEALNREAESRLQILFKDIFSETNPKEKIRKTIELPFHVPESEYDFWKLQFKLKWEKEYFHENKMKPVIDMLTNAFEALGFENPGHEARLLNQIIDSISVEILKGQLTNKMEYMNFLLRKYKI